MRLISKISLFLLCLSLAACTTNSRQQQIVNQQFLTDIKENDSKLFVFIVNFLQERPTRNQQLGLSGQGGQGRGGEGRGQSRGSARSLQDLDEKLEKSAINALESKLELTGYCREGYFILSNYMERGNIEIRGECKESATDADRKLFSNA
ncbi:MAG: hypothetical protein GJ680_01035 [Alteromonadaceae bacterium]|nr:hypothetical protein [Alteromonadaceae bacterium]